MNGQQITNLEAAQVGDKIIISYLILSEDENQTFSLFLECSTDGGKIFRDIPKTVSGDFIGVTAGTNKRLVWDVFKDIDELSGNNIVFRLSALTYESSITVSGSKGTFADTRDGRTYKWVKIGEHIWMAENLAYLPSVSEPSTGSQTEPFMYVYGYDGIDVAAAKATANYFTYGVLYNWPAAMTACPEGWHLPSDAEWEQLNMYLGTNQVDSDGNDYHGTDQGTQMKSTNGWNNNGNGNNSSGFIGLPGGKLYDKGSFSYIGNYGYWWSSTVGSTNYAWCRFLGYGSTNLTRYSYCKEDGFNLRCLRD